MWDQALEYLELGWKIFAVAATLGWAGFMLKMRGTFVTKAQFGRWLKSHEEDHRSIEARFTRGQQQFAGIEATLKTLATAEQLAEVRTSVTKVQGEIAQLEERIEGHHQVNLRTERMVNTLHDYLLQQTGAR